MYIYCVLYELDGKLHFHSAFKTFEEAKYQTNWFSRYKATVHIAFISRAPTTKAIQ